MYHFLSGYTSKLAGTERGVTTPQATFSTCFGAPFMPRPPVEYAHMLGERLDQHGAQCYLLNTGWTGGPYGIGKRMDLLLTRTMVGAALSGALANAEYTVDPIFRLNVPIACSGVPANILSSRGTWSDPAAYDVAARNLASLFHENFKKFSGVSETITNAGPFPV